MGVQAGEVWSDVPPLPDVRMEEADLYLRMPTVRSAERVHEHLRSAGHDVSIGEDPYKLTVPRVDPLSALHAIVDVLTPPERQDALAVLRPCGTELEAMDKLFALSVEKLCNRLSATWLVDLLRARRLTSAFQPIVDSTNLKSVKGYEVLIRAHHNGEMVNTRRMFAIAESAHIMSQLDALAMQIAVETAAEHGVSETLFINCSPAHMHDPFTRVAEFAVYTHRLGLRPEQIVLEVVETERHDRDHLRSFMVACRRHGFHVALDDLGSGYSSLTVLSDLRPDIIKLDRDLVSAINIDPYRALIVNRLIEASRVLGLMTVVEGVETEAELKWAAANGATYAQGNFIARPGPLRNR